MHEVEKKTRYCLLTKEGGRIVKNPTPEELEKLSFLGPVVKDPDLSLVKGIHPSQWHWDGQKIVPLPLTPESFPDKLEKHESAIQRQLNSHESSILSLRSMGNSVASQVAVLASQLHESRFKHQLFKERMEKTIVGLWVCLGCTILLLLGVLWAARF